MLYILTFAVAPKVFAIASAERGYDGALGGEVFIFLIPLIIWVWYEEYKQMKKEQANEV